MCLKKIRLLHLTKERQQDEILLEIDNMQDNREKFQWIFF